MNSYKASDKNDVNGARAAPGTASGRRLEVSPTVTMRNPQSLPPAQQPRLHAKSSHQNETKTFDILKTTGDGNCLFRSVSLHLYGHEDRHKDIREQAVKYIRMNWNEVKDYIVRDTREASGSHNLTAINQRSYCYEMRQDGTYGTSVEIMALSEAYKLNFNVYSVEERPRNQQMFTSATPTKIAKRRHGTDINLLLIGDPGSGHFELLKNVDTNEENREVQSQDELGRSVSEDYQRTVDAEDPQAKEGAEVNNRFRKKWTEAEYCEILWCHLHTVETTGTVNLQETYKMWTARNPNSRHKMTANTLAIQRRFILNSNKISPEKFESIKNQVLVHIKGNIQDREDNEHSETCENTGNGMEIGTEQVETNRNDDQVMQDTAGGYVLPISREDFLQKVLDHMEKEHCQVAAEDIQRIPLRRINDTEKSRRLILLGNEIISELLQKYPGQYENITSLNKLTYAVAITIEGLILPKTKPEKKPKKEGDPPWKKRIQSQIGQMRKDLSHLKESQNRVLSEKMEKTRDILYTQYKIKNAKDHARVMEGLKQKIMAKACRIKRFSKRTQQFQQNKMFLENTSKFYNSIIQKGIKATETPREEEIHDYWQALWNRNTKHNKEAWWIQEEYDKNEHIERMRWKEISEADVKTALGSSANWKAAGPDGIPNFWHKKLQSTHRVVARIFNSMIQNEDEIPGWFVKGKTYLIPKSEKTEDAKEYRPITCLNTIYKMLTKLISERIYCHLTENCIFPEEQKGCLKNTYGCKDQLLISKMVNRDCKENGKSLSLAWIDYRKAFDNIPHSWLLEAMNIYKISHEVLSFVAKTMAMWKVDLHLTTPSASIKIKDMQIKNGIYQGDSLSPLLFCMSLFPLSSMLKNSNMGYRVRKETEKISHLLYIDDLKIIAKNDEELAHQLEMVREFSDDIQMEFGVEKCAKASFIKGKLSKSQSIVLNEKTTIRSLEPHEVYKYLGVEEHDGIHNKQMKVKLTKEYVRRTREILKTELSGRNKLQAITSLAVPVIQYSFGILKWTNAEIRKLDCTTRKLLTIYGALHPRADVDRLYVPRKEGGRGLSNIELCFSTATQGIANYIKLKSQDKFLGMVYRQQTEEIEKKMYEQSSSERIESTNPDKPATVRVKEISQRIKDRKKMELKTRWNDKEMHGQIKREAEKSTINTAQSWRWLTAVNLKAETEAIITACQDQAIATNYVKSRIMKSGSDPKCRLCRTQNETIHHIVSGCSVLAKQAYLDRHNRVAAHLHWNICREFKVEVQEKWYQHKPDPVIDTPEITLIWDSQVTTDRTILANKPDIILKDKKMNICLLIDVSIPSDYNISQKEAEKLIKYKDLQIEVQRMWHMKSTVVPIIIGATGLVSKATCEAITLIPGRHNLLRMQKSVLLSTAHIVRKAI